jgi:hypothetical protein
MQLSQTVIEDSVVVYQNGIEEQDWYYLATTNTVYFEFDVEEGSIVKVGYKTLVE